MKKTAAERFAYDAGRLFYDAITQRAACLGIEKEQTKSPPDILSEEEKTEWEQLAEKVRKDGYETAVRKGAQLWFNRFIAFRYMEVNGFLPNRDDPLSSRTVESMLLMFNRNDSPRNFVRTLFSIPASFFPDLFELDQWAELLLSKDLWEDFGIVYRLISDIPEETWKEGVQVLGRLYQYFNAGLKSGKPVLHGKKVKKDDLPLATQLFTPNWLVRYMVENSLGRLWLDIHSNSVLLDDWHYFFKQPKQTPNVELQLQEIRKNRGNLDPHEIKLIDPCVGYGNILVYAFDLFIEFYRKIGILPQEAASEIISKNLYGLDIDESAVEMTRFALMMKARKHDPYIFERKPEFHICSFAGTELESLDTRLITSLCSNDPVLKKEFVSLCEFFRGANIYGSLISTPEFDVPFLRKRLKEILSEPSADCRELKPVRRLLKLMDILVQKYDVTVTNPPYLGIRNMNRNLSQFIRKNYADFKYDTFSAFMVKCCLMTRPDGYIGMFTPYAWMFIQSYEKLRKFLCERIGVKTLLQLEFCAFGDASVPLCSFVFQNNPIPQKGAFIRTTKFGGGMDIQKQKVLEAARNRFCSYYFESGGTDFQKIPGIRFVFWGAPALLDALNAGQPLKVCGDTRQGISTCDNRRFVRFWFEVDYNSIGFGCRNSREAAETGKKWFPFNKGGGGRKWYGNKSWVVNYENDGKEVKDFVAARHGNSGRTVKSTDRYFQESLSWSKISGTQTAFRYYENGFVFSDAGCAVFYNDRRKMFYDLGFLNSVVAQKFLEILSPTVNSEAGQVASLPVIDCREKSAEIETLVKENIRLAQLDWDSFERSWDFRVHPLIREKQKLISAAFDRWKKRSLGWYRRIESNEQRLNQIFADIYQLQGEFDSEGMQPREPFQEANKAREIRSLVSFTIGFFFGRFALETHKITLQNMNREIFFCGKNGEDELTSLFIKLISDLFGKESLEENLEFVAESLGGKGRPSETIRNYIWLRFWSDHLKTYSNRPIYWLFESGKGDGGFKALVCYHRITSDTLFRLLSAIHKRMEELNGELNYLKEISCAIPDEKRERRIKAAELLFQEVSDYEKKIRRLAEEKISFDLDDGIEFNFSQFKDVLPKVRR